MKKFIALMVSFVLVLGDITGVGAVKITDDNVLATVEWSASDFTVATGAQTQTVNELTVQTDGGNDKINYNFDNITYILHWNGINPNGTSNKRKLIFEADYDGNVTLTAIPIANKYPTSFFVSNKETGVTEEYYIGNSINLTDVNFSVTANNTYTIVADTATGFSGTGTGLRIKTVKYTYEKATPTLTASPTPTVTVAPTPTITPTASPTPTATPTVTPVPAVTPTPTITSTPTTTPPLTPAITPTPTIIPTATPTITPTSTPTPTPTIKVTPTPTATPIATPTITVALTATPLITPTPTATIIPTVTPTVIATTIPTEIPVKTATPTQTPEVTLKPTVAPTTTPKVTVAPTDKPINNEIISFDGNYIEITVNNTDMVVYAVSYYENGQLKSIETFSIDKIGKQSIKLKNNADKVMLWDKNMKPYDTKQK